MRSHDIFNEIRGWPLRVEWQVVQQPLARVVTGFRESGEWTIYYGEDPHYQFDASGGLRRAFVEGLLYRSAGTVLSELRREQAPLATPAANGATWQTVLTRRDLTLAETEQFVVQMRHRLAKTVADLSASRLICICSQPDDGKMSERFQQRLQTTLSAGTPLSPALVYRG